MEHHRDAEDNSNPYRATSHRMGFSSIRPGVRLLPSFLHFRGDISVRNGSNESPVPALDRVVAVYGLPFVSLSCEGFRTQKAWTPANQSGVILHPPGEL